MQSIEEIKARHAIISEHKNPDVDFVGDRKRYLPADAVEQVDKNYDVVALVLCTFNAAFPAAHIELQDTVPVRVNGINLPPTIACHPRIHVRKGRSVLRAGDPFCGAEHGRLRPQGS